MYGSTEMNYRSMTNDELIDLAYNKEQRNQTDTLEYQLAKRLEQEQEKVKYLEELTGEQA